MTFAVIKQIEVPERPKRFVPRRESQYPFANLEVGDGFDCPRFAKVKSTGRKTDRYHTIGPAARSWGARNAIPGYRVSVYKLDDNTVRVVRVA